MKNLHSTAVRPIKRSVAVIITICAGALLMSAVIAQNTQSQPKAKPCENWPPDVIKDKVKAAFDKVISTATADTEEGRKLRAKLLDSRNCYKSPKAEMERTFDEMFPTEKIRFPKGSLVVFYEPEKAGARDYGFAENYPGNHCLHIFYLDTVGSKSNAKPSFANNLMCCYPPW